MSDFRLVDQHAVKRCQGWRRLTIEYTARAAFNYRSRGHIGIYSKVGSFSFGNMARRAGDSRLLRFNSGIAEIYGLSGKTSPQRRLQYTPGELSVSLYIVTFPQPTRIYRTCGLTQYGIRVEA